MKAAAACALIVLGGAVAACAAQGGAAGSGCPRPAEARPDPHHGFELDVWGARGVVTDVEGRIGNEIPGAYTDFFLLDTPPDFYAQLAIFAERPNSYVVRMVGKDTFPLTFTLSRKRVDPDEFVAEHVASWFVPRRLEGTRITLAFASGQRLRDVRLCVGGRAIAPTGLASGAASRDQDPPIMSSSFVSAGAGRVRVTLRARDASSGVAGIWYLVRGHAATHADAYRAPITVDRGADLTFWATDRAGNEDHTYALTR